MTLPFRSLFRVCFGLPRAAGDAGVLKGGQRVGAIWEMVRTIDPNLPVDERLDTR